jgi:competence protein ComEA
MKFFALAGAAAILAAFAFLRPAPGPAVSVGRAPGPSKRAVRPGAARHQPARPAFSSVVVYVAGEVRNAGLYRLQAGARANDALEKAGGFAPGADRAGVNLAEVVQDGEEIRVPKIGEKPAHPRKTPGRKKRSKKSRPPASIDLNSASADELAQVPGLGRTLAERIVAYRTLNGRFASLDELADVSGITQRRIDALAQYFFVR